MPARGFGKIRVVAILAFGNKIFNSRRIQFVGYHLLPIHPLLHVAMVYDQARGIELADRFKDLIDRGDQIV